VKAAVIKEAILAMGESFAEKDVADRVGRSPMTVKVVIGCLVAQDPPRQLGQLLLRHFDVERADVGTASVAGNAARD
jgi:hypothetical protein